MNSVSVTIVVADGDLRIPVIMIGTEEKSYLEATREAGEEMAEVSKMLGGNEPKDHRRGSFKTLTSGFSYGGGQAQPMNFNNTKTEENMVSRLNASRCFRRIANFGSGEPLC